MVTSEVSPIRAGRLAGESEEPPHPSSSVTARPIPLFQDDRRVHLERPRVPANAFPSFAALAPNPAPAAAPVARAATMPAHHVPPRFYGSYTGLSPRAVQTGASFEDAQVRFRVDATGYTTIAPLAGGQVAVLQGPEWYIASRSLEGVSDDAPGLSAYAVGQSPGSGLASEFLLFRNEPQEGAPDVLMLLGEGMPLLLGRYYRDDARGPRTSTLRDLYEALRRERLEPAQSQEARDWLPPLDPRAADIMRDGTAGDRVSIIRRAGSNLWLGTDDDVKTRMALIEHGTRDADPQVRIAALRQFEVGARLTASVPLALAALARESDSAVANEAVEAVTSLLSDAARSEKRSRMLTQRFGSSDVATIVRQLDRPVTREEYKALTDAESAAPTTRFTEAHAEALRRGLEEVLARAESGAVSLSPAALATARRALVDYARR